MVKDGKHSQYSLTSQNRSNRRKSGAGRCRKERHGSVFQGRIHLLTRLILTR